MRRHWIHAIIHFLKSRNFLIPSTKYLTLIQYIGLILLDIVAKNAIPSLQPVDIAIFNMLGQIVYQEKLLPLSQGVHSFTWNGKDLLQQDVSSGLYLINVTAGEFQSIRKITYIK